MQPKTSDLRTLVTHTAVLSALKNGSDGSNDTDLDVSSTKGLALSAPDKIDVTTSGPINLACSALTLSCGPNTARMSLTANNELLFEVKDAVSASYVTVAKFITAVV